MFLPGRHVFIGFCFSGFCLIYYFGSGGIANMLQLKGKSHHD
jgi:hypothetical protein